MIGLGWVTLYHTMIQNYEMQKESTSTQQEKITIINK